MEYEVNNATRGGDCWAGAASWDSSVVAHVFMVARPVAKSGRQASRAYHPIKRIDSGLFRLYPTSVVDQRGRIERYWTVKELAEFSQESEMVWRKRIRSRQITHCRFGSNVRVPQSALDEWMKLRTVQHE